MPAAGHILVLEDDHDNAFVVRLVLERAGHQVAWARSLAEARTLVARVAPDLAVLDLVLPDGDALDLCAELRARTPAVPIIVLTAWDEPRLRAAAAEACADVFLSKPFDVDALEQAAGDLLTA